MGSSQCDPRCEECGCLDCRCNAPAAKNSQLPPVRNPARAALEAEAKPQPGWCTGCTPESCPGCGEAALPVPALEAEAKLAAPAAPALVQRLRKGAEHLGRYDTYGTRNTFSALMDEAATAIEGLLKGEP